MYKEESYMNRWRVIGDAWEETGEPGLAMIARWMAGDELGSQSDTADAASAVGWLVGVGGRRVESQRHGPVSFADIWAGPRKGES